MVAHPRHLFLGAVSLGLALSPLGSTSAAVAAAVAAAAVAAGASRVGPVRGSRPGPGALAVAAGVAVLCGGLGGHARLAALDRTELGSWIGHAARLRVIVLEPVRQRSFAREAGVARIAAGAGRGERVLLRAPVSAGLARVDTGAEARVVGGFRALPDFESAARRRGAHALVAVDSVAATGRRRGGLAGAIDAIRRRADRALSVGLPAPLAALGRGMVLGEDEALPDGMRDDFRASGLAHLVAASGTNVALLAALVLLLCAVVGVSLRARLVLALAAVAGYVPLAGAGPSIQRAGVMGCALLVAALASRPASRAYALLLAAAVTLGLDPRALDDAGWQLSFAAVLGLLVMVPALRARLRRRLPAGLAEALAVTLAASAATAPLIAWHFGRVSLVSVPANVLAAPAVAPVMWSGTLAAVVGQAAPGLAAPLTGVAAWPLAFLAWLAHATAAIPGAGLEWPPSAGVSLGFLALAAGAIAASERRAPGHRRAATVAALALALAAATAAVRAARGPAPPSGLVVSALDIGQGDATLAQHGRAAILVDAGPPDGPIVARLHEAGVRRLDVLVVTHAQADHEGGAAAVLAALPVGVVLDGRDGVRSADGDRFAAVARSRGVGLVAPEAGQLIRAGPMTLDVLSPRREAAGAHAGEDPNRRAIVAELDDGGFSMLLTADAESDVLSTLPLGPVDVLKVAHHGSADPGLPGLLARLRPVVALVEVGRHNVYHHPAPATVRALRAVPQVLRTDRDGTVRLSVGSGQIRVAHSR